MPSRPVAVAATKPIFQLCALLIAANFTYWGFTYMIQLVSAGFYQPWPYSVRFSTVGLRDPGISILSASPIVFGLLKDGCPISPQSQSSNGTATVVSASAIEANGYYFQVLNGSILADPVQWKVEIKGEGNMDMWKIVGASVWLGQGYSATYYPNLPFPTPMQRKMQINFDARPSWPWFLSETVTSLCTGIGWFIYSVSRFSGMQQAGTSIVCLIFLFNCLLEASAAIGYGLSGPGYWRQTVQLWLFAVPDGVFAVSVWLNERHVVRVMIVYGFLKILPLV